jgi:hypothetical protein
MGVPSTVGSWDAEDDFLLKNAVEVTAIELSSTSPVLDRSLPDALLEFPLARRGPDSAISRDGLIAVQFPYAAGLARRASGCSIIWRLRFSSRLSDFC